MNLSDVFNNRRFNVLAFALIALLIFIAYFNTFTASFHFDDDAAIAENPSIKRVTSENIMNLLHTNRPIVMLSLMLNYSLNGINVVGWHVFNIAFHVANSCLVYLLLLGTFKLPVFHDRYSAKAPRMALFGALLFAVHPIQTESVTYIISRTELLATFFYLASFLLFIRGALLKKTAYYIGAFITSLCAMASKEWAATLPVMLFLYDYIFISEGKLKNVTARGKAYLLFILPWFLAAYLLKDTLFSGNSAGFGIAGQKGLTPWTYLLTSFNVIWTYIRLLFLPINQNLDYDYKVSTTLFEFPTLFSFIGHLIVLGGAFWLYKKKGWLVIPFGIAWFYIALSPTQSFVPILDVIFEHRVYLPSIGFFMAFIAGYEQFFEMISARINRKSGSVPAVHKQT